jgi:hypothetical protein
MSVHNKLRKHLYSSVGPALLAAMSLATNDASWAACMGPGAPTTTQTKCLTAITIPGNPLRSFDISWVNPDRAEYYFADRSNAAIQVIDTQHKTWKRTLGGFVGIITNPPCGVSPKPACNTVPVNNNLSGPDGVTTHGRWVYAGDGNSDLRVYDLNQPDATAFQQKISTGGTTRLDEMALTSDGKLLIAANNAEDPPFATLFKANGDDGMSHVSKIIRITIDPTIVPPGAGLSIEQPAWDPKTQRFYTSVPIIANNPPGCNFDGNKGPITCEGGLLVTDPMHPKAVEGAFDKTSNTGVIPLHACGPNGATVGPHDNLLLGCNPGNVPDNVTTLVINAKTHNYANIGLITGADEVWFNKGDNRYYLGASKNCADFSKGPCPTTAQQAAVLGVIDKTSVLIETIPQSSNSHSVAADSKRNLIFVPQVAPATVVGPGGDNALNVGAGICGTTNGCVAVYKHDVDDDDHEGDDDDHKDDRRSER